MENHHCHRVVTSFTVCARSSHLLQECQATSPLSLYLFQIRHTVVPVNVSFLGSSDLMCIESGIKFNVAYSIIQTSFSVNICYLLSASSHPFHMWRLFSFPQQNFSAHSVRETMKFLSKNISNFTFPLIWPPNGPNSIQSTTKCGGVLQQRVNRSRIRDVDHLKQRLMEEWCYLDHEIIGRAVQQ